MLPLSFPPEPPSSQLIHVVDSDPPFRESLALMLEATGRPVRSFATGQALLDHVTRSPGGCCALIDWSLPDLPGLTLIESLKALAPALPVILMTAEVDLGLAVRAMKAGALDVLEKPFDLHTLLEALQGAAVRQNQPGVSDSELASFQQRLTSLTERERQVLEGLIAGQPAKVIATRCGISPSTVHVHRAHIATKLGVKGLSRLVHLALAAGVGFDRDKWS